MDSHQEIAIFSASLVKDMKSTQWYSGSASNRSFFCSRQIFIVRLVDGGQKTYGMQKIKILA
ncbi:MAG: hypothetical protein EBS81_03535 [Gammaproteobacteria bacterium]|nr:hypothetical protein [Gammaproteobacteria bacterium]